MSRQHVSRALRCGQRLLAVPAALAVVAAVTSAAVGSSPTVKPSTSHAAVQRDDTTTTDTIRPLVIVLDTSGSMSEDDGTGTIKLAGAQAALSTVIRQQRPGAQVGLWSYPSDSDCASGRFQIPVRDLEQRSMIRAIRALEADGETPTGDALRSVVDQLTSNGYSGATILLISDGLSNCGEDPCEVAQAVTDEGFDLTVNTAGFQISPEGQDELNCIASATGGSTYEANDSDDLAETVADATRAELTMEVTGIPTEIPAGSATRVKITVTNASAVDVQNARISLTFGATGEQQSLIPAALPPLVRLGNMPAGAVAEHSWVVSYGSRGKTGSTAYRAAAWGTNAQPREETGVVRVTDANLGWDQASGPIAGLKGEKIAIVGDSYSAGEGGGDYFKGTDRNKYLGWLSNDNRCHKSPHTYLYPLFDSTDVALIACSGATTHKIGDASAVQEEQVPLLRSVQEEHGPLAAAFMTIGGNDIEFGTIVAQCVQLGTCSKDTELTDRTDRLLNGLQPDLEQTYKDVYQTLNSRDAVEQRHGELAPLYILPYPQAFPESQWLSWCRGFNREEVAWANNLVDDLDSVIEKAVETVRHEGYRVQFVSTVQEAFLPDNTSCPRPGGQAYMHTVDLATGIGAKVDQAVLGLNRVQEFMHPNADGYRAETNVVLAWSVDAPEDLPQGVREWRPRSSQVPGPGLIDRIRDLLTPTLPVLATATFDASTGEFSTDPIDVRAGQRFDVEVTNAMPGSTTMVTIASREQVIGSVDVGERGTGRATITVPDDLVPGAHQLTSIAVSADGTMTVGNQSVDVSRAIPPWLLPLGGATLLAFAAWFVLGRRHRHSLRAANAADDHHPIEQTEEP